MPDKPAGRDKIASAETFKKRLEYASKDNFYTLADEYLETLNNSGRYWTWKQTKVAVQKIRNYHKSDKLTVNLIDDDFLTKFQGYLRRKNKPSAILKNFGNLKNILNLAVRKHLLPAYPMNSENFKLVKNNKSGSKTKLTLEHLQKIENLNLEPGSNLWYARNAFILSFYFCGMRFGDIAELRWSNVKNGRLEYDMNKTGSPVNLPIKDGARKILNAYKDADKNGYVLEFLSYLLPIVAIAEGAVSATTLLRRN